MSTEQLRFTLALDTSGIDSSAAKATKSLRDIEKAADQVGTTTEKAGTKASAGLDKATTATKKTGKAVDETAAAQKKAGDAATEAGAKSEAAAKRSEKAAMSQKEAVDKVGNSLLVAGAASLAIAAGSVALASSWESDFAGVQKTVDGTVQEMAALEDQLRGITKVASSSHTEVAAVGEAAGQLGVHREDVAKFTKTMIDLGVATNLTAEQGAVSIKQFMNIMGSAPDDVDRIASAVVGLGNNSATTEADIVNMSQRLAGAGKQARMSEPEVLAMAAAMASVGIEAEAGGTAMSLTLKQIDAMARNGGPKLDILGRIAGMSGEQFKQAWGASAAEATNTLILGLGRMAASGEDVNGVLDDLGFEGIRQSDTLLRLSGATQAMGGEVDLLTQSLKISAEEFERNTALQIEAETRYGTTAEKAKIAQNQIKDGLIDMGNALLPIANDGIQVVSDLATAFAALPDSVKGGIGMMSGLVGVMALGAGGALKAATAFNTAKTALAGLGVSMRGVTLAGGAVGLLLAGAAVLIGAWARKNAEAKQYQDDLAAALRETNGELRDQNGLFHDNIRATAAVRAEELGLLEQAERWGVAVEDVTAAMLGDVDARQRVIDKMDEHIAKKQELADADDAGEYELLQLNAMKNRRDELVEGIDREAAANDGAVESTKRVTEARGDDADAATKQEEATRKQAEVTAEAARKQGELAEATRAAEEALRKHIDALYAESDAKTAALTGTLNVNSAMLDAADRAKVWKEEAEKAGESTKDAFDKTTRAGIENNRVMLKAADTAKDDIRLKVEQGKSVESILAADKKYRDGLIETAQQFGYNKKEATAYVDEILGTPETAETIAELKQDVAAAKLAEWQSQLDGLPESVESEIKALLDRGKLAEAERLLNQAARDRTATLTVHTKNTNYSPSGSLSNLDPTKPKADGGILEYHFAAGGALSRVGDVRNAHKPEIVPAGTNRLFAEDETGGEAYIPLANDWRRGRAENILATVADRFGLALVKDVTAFASGGVAAFAAGGATMPDKALSSVLAGLQIGAFPVAAITAYTAALTKAHEATVQAAAAEKDKTNALAKATAATARASKAVKAADRDLDKAKTGTKAYREAEKDLKKASAAVDPSSQLGKNRTALRDLQRKSTSGMSKSQKKARKTKIDALQKKVDRAEDKRNLRIAEARDKLDWHAEKRDKAIAAAEKKLEKAKTAEAKAKEKETKAKDKEAAASQKLTDKKAKEQKAADDLTAAHQRLADTARQASDAFVSKWMGTGTDLAGSIESMTEGIAAGSAFADQIEQLRKMKLSEDYIQQVIIPQGEIWGGDLAAEIIKGGKPTVAVLNDLTKKLDKVGDRLGMTTAVGVKKYATGGLEVHEATIGTGVTRVWDEPETGGEAYIPLAESKRRRSLAIWAETGRRLGVAQPVRRFADGAVVPPTATFARTPETQTITYVTNIHQVELPGVKTLHEMDGVAREMALKIHRSGARRG